MNCLDYRRALLTEPQAITPEMREHAKTCSACAAFENDQQAFETALHSTMQVDVPDGLASRILLAQSTGQIQTQKRKRRILAVAASFILAIGISMGIQLYPLIQPVDQLVLSHINHEAKHLNDRLNVDPVKVSAILGKLHMRLKEPLGTVNYAGNCDIRKKELGAHLILQGKNGPVSVLIMPAEDITTRHRIADNNFHGVIVPTPRGSVAIVGEHDEVLEPFVKQIGRVIQM